MISVQWREKGAHHVDVTLSNVYARRHSIRGTGVDEAANGLTEGFCKCWNTAWTAPHGSWFFLAAWTQRVGNTVHGLWEPEEVHCPAGAQRACTFQLSVRRRRNREAQTRAANIIRSGLHVGEYARCWLAVLELCS